MKLLNKYSNNVNDSSSDTDSTGDDGSDIGSDLVDQEQQTEDKATRNRIIDAEIFESERVNLSCLSVLPW